MDKIIVEGGHPLSGEVKISGAKNAALPMLISSLLTDGACTYSNVPDLMDIHSTTLLLSHLGAHVETEGDTVRIDAGGRSIPRRPMIWSAKCGPPFWF